MRLRAAKASDADAVAAIWNPVIAQTTVTFKQQELTPGRVAELIAERGDTFLVAETDEAVAGFASYGPFRSGPGYRHSVEHTIHVAASARGQGVGRALLAALEEVARKHEVHAMIGAVSGENAAALSFHESMGFREVGRMPEAGRKFGRWLDLVLVQKLL